MSETVQLSWDDAPEIARRLGDGAVAVLPTDTVYGLAAAPVRTEATARIFDLKNRPGARPLPILIPDPDALAPLGVEVSESAARLLRSRFMPGALTLVLGFADGPRPDWLAGREEVAVRIPAHEALRALMRLCGPLAATSANAHGRPTPETLAEILAQLAGAPELAVAEDPLPTAPSTIVNCRLDPVGIEREGVISETAIREFLG